MADTQVEELVINTITKEDFEAIENPSATQLWLVEEDEDTQWAKDSQVVHNVGKETIEGEKTFTDKVVLHNGQTYTLDITDDSNAIATTKFVHNLVAPLLQKIAYLEAQLELLQ